MSSESLLGLRRNRINAPLRNLVSSESLNPKKLVQPIFVAESLKSPEKMSSLPGVFRDSQGSILSQIESDLKNGVEHFLLFLVPEKKSDDSIPKSFYKNVIGSIKSKFPEAFLWVDTCLCSLTTHGHCGLLDPKGRIENVSSVKRLSELALCYAESGADGISPSDMMDGRIKSHRNILDSNGFQHVPIMSYSTKFKSHFYGPFREAAESAPGHGDRSSYQIDVRNREDSILSSIRDTEEGADLLMVKPGITSIDLILPIKEQTGLPVGAYQVSGEYASIALLAENGFCKFEDALKETWQVFSRAGASYLITYAARRGKEILG
ncbi:porphobilinogen synthase [Leptospira licerasiae]|uniref:Delta-aminolevulinic acid dehydratase n=1 Tax=Leptospira licerasiae str. MMD4847 TaxID=1049971 RepID=A0ABN0HDQ2_9LEPT|nr:porphobilinogen synthase [Leptospira licerasiae]EIE01126.1 porphobilinogen synthase [Leptospira licerasiae serovar Varillal str. VAR 010]EJZ43755.1 porphobilinogen synthase [Leptospira licerasiae str. MMD4847]